jgi:hypothetical protein
MSKSIIHLIIFLVALLSLSANESPYSFLRTNASARNAGMAGAVVSLRNDPSAIFFNPALISTVDSSEFSFTFLKHVLDINSGNAVYVYKGMEDGVLAGQVAFSNYGTFEARDNTGKPTGRTFPANSLSAGITYSNELDRNFYYGVTAKFIYFGLEDLASTAMALDAGLYYRLKDTLTSLGVSINNAGFQLSKFNNVADKLPLDLRLGVNHRLKGLPLLINFNFHHLADSTENFFERFKNFAIGGEFYFGKYLQARFGYDNQIRNTISNETSKGLSGFSFGAGVVLNDLNIDYAFSQYGTAVILHRISLGLDLK